MDNRDNLGRFTKENSGEKNVNWNGGKTIDRYGYIKILKPNHPMSDSKGYVYEHRYVMSQKLKKVLNKNEIVHHINGIKTDNSIDNLELIMPYMHKYIHGKEKCNLPKIRQYKMRCSECGGDFVGGNRSILCGDCRTLKCKYCGNTFKTFPTHIKNGTRKYCSKKCASSAKIIHGRYTT